MQAARKPPALAPGDCVAVLSPSWGGPHTYPHVFEAGSRVLQRTLGLQVREYPTTRLPPQALFEDPAARAGDLTAAFEDDTVKAVLVSIGGEDSLRILPHVDFSRVAAHPKIFMGYSDATTLLLSLRRAGLVTFHGPSVMAGLAQAPSFPDTFVEHLRAVLFDAATVTYQPYPWYVQSYPDWKQGAEVASAVGTKVRNRAGFRVVQGTGRIRAEVLGGCIDVMAFMLGTEYFPSAEDFAGKLLLLETSEEKPSPEAVRRLLWNFAVQGIFDRLAGVLLGRARDYRPDETARLESYVVATASDCGRPDLPIVSNVDVGHTDPQLVVPFGSDLVVDLDAGTMALAEPAVTVAH